MVPASHNNQLTLLALGVLGPSKLNIKNRCHRLESLLDGYVWLILVLLSLCPNFEDEAISFSWTEENKAVVKVNKAAT